MQEKWICLLPFFLFQENMFFVICGLPCFSTINHPLVTHSPILEPKNNKETHLATDAKEFFTLDIFTSLGYRIARYYISHDF